MKPVRFEVFPKVSSAQLNRLYAKAWPHHMSFDFDPVIRQCLRFVCAYDGKELVGSVYMAWDGAQHAFLLEPTVLSRLRHRGIGSELVRIAVEVARDQGCEWVHVDYVAPSAPSYRACGFRPTTAGLIRLGLLNHPKSKRDNPQA